VGEEVKRPKPTYPPHWKAFSLSIRRERAGSRCECRGECGLHPGRFPVNGRNLKRRCIERDGAKAVYAKGKVVLTVAHLCRCEPPCARRTHVKAMCNRCHLRVDVPLHQKHARETRHAKREASHYPLFEKVGDA
jgi:hypothetical protein